MNKLLLLLVVFFSVALGINAQTVVKMPFHPRLLLLRGEENAIKNAVGSDSVLALVHQQIMKKCDAFLLEPPVKQIKIGRRLLDKSRECLRRVFFLSYAYRMTHDDRYFQRAEEEMLAVSAFTDWNPTHFLDVAEMTMALAIGYDWLYNRLPETSRKIIKTAILKKGIEESLKDNYNKWQTWTNNWNQVCNAGMTYGALSVYEENPALADKIIERAIQSIKIPMTNYGPDGGYAEGPMYWGYGTSFNVLFISAVEKVFKQDFGLSAMPGFLKTADYLLHVTGPSGLYFDYSDGHERGQINPAMFWFSGKQGSRNYLLRNEKRYITENPKSLANERLLPALMVWGAGQHLDAIDIPPSTMWVSKGETPVAVMRSSWTDPDAVYVAFKGGSPSTSHAHMDEGSFVLDAEGIRWAIDLGMQEYESLESKGLNIWNNSQHGQRWSVLRYTNRMHNTLTVNDSLQWVNGSAPIIQSGNHPSFQNAVVDLSQVYKGYLAKAERGVALIDNSYVLVRDEVETGNNVATIRWKILTRATVEIKDTHTALLIQGGKRLTLKIDGPEDIRLQKWETPTPASYDAPNPGVVLVGFETKVSALTKTVFSVQFIPEGVKPGQTIQPLQYWNE
ncbi:MAG: heparinase II/III family protein [Bacteroidota bacterium]|nr:heparinase II/III family protein [Bacteroidota bacterium]